MFIKVGNTPMIKIKYKYKGKENQIYAKLESYNLTGSIKDRVAYYMIVNAYKSGKLKKGMEIVEATSGNTGIALSAIGRGFGNKVHIFMPDWVSAERYKIMKMYGAEITLVSKKDGGFKRAIELAKYYAEKNGAFYCNQFSNINNVLAHYETTGKEIIDKLGYNIGGFVSGIGTGGTIIGTGKRLKGYNPTIKVYALEPEQMPLLSQNKILGEHKIEGIGDEFVPDIIDRTIIDKIVLINDIDSINMSKKLAQNLGLGVGISSGANMIASILAKEENKKEIVTVFPDDNKKYLTTDLSKDINNDNKLLSNNIEIISIDYV